MAPEETTTENPTTENPTAAAVDRSGPPEPSAADAGGAPAAKTTKRAPRRATKKASAPPASTAAASTTPTTAAASTSATRATKAATKKAAALAAAPETSASQADAAQTEGPAANDSEQAPPVKRATRKRVTRKQTAAQTPVTTGAVDGVEATQATSSEPSPPGATTGRSAPAKAQTATARSATAKSATAETGAAAATEAPASASSLEVLFQAPEPAATRPAAGRRRRVAAAAGAPGTQETVVTGASTTAGEDPASTPSTGAPDTAEHHSRPSQPGQVEQSGQREKSGKAEKPRKATKSGKAEKLSKAEKPKKTSKSGKGKRAGKATGEVSPENDREAGGLEPRPGERPPDDEHASDVLADQASEPDETPPRQTADGAQADDDAAPRRSRRRRGGKGRRGRGASDDRDPQTVSAGSPADSESSAASGTDAPTERTRDAAGSTGPESAAEGEPGDDESASSRRRRRRRRGGGSGEDADDSPSTGGRTRASRSRSDEPTAVRGSTRLEAKKQRRRDGREAGRRRTVITEAEFLARREAVDRVMVVRNKDGRTQMGVLEDGVLVEHYIDQATNVSMAGNIYLGRVQNVLPSMEAAFVDIGKGRNAVLYAGEVNWDAAGLEGNQPKRIENALGSGQTVLVQVTKDPIGHKGARLTSQISLPGRYLVYVPNSSMTGISRKLPDTERARLKKILRDVVPDSAGVIVRTAAEGASEAELRADVERLTATWEEISARAEASSSGKAGKSKGRKSNGGSGSSPVGTAPLLLHGEPDLTVRVIRDVFNEDFTSLVVSGEQAWEEIHPYISSVAPDLESRVSKWTGTDDLFTHHRVDEQLAKAMDRKVWLPSGGSLVIDRTEAMTVVDVNTGKFVGSGGNLEETVTKNNIEAAEEIVRQLRLRDIGGIIVVDFIDMVLESNRDLVVRRLLECLGRDRTKHQVAEVTSLGLVQMTRKRVGSGLIEVFGESCEACNGRGFIIHSDPVDRGSGSGSNGSGSGSNGGGSHEGGSNGSGSGNGRSRRGRSNASGSSGSSGNSNSNGSGGAGDGNGSSGAGSAGSGGSESPRSNGPTAAQIAAAAHAAALKTTAGHSSPEIAQQATSIADDLAAELASDTSELGIDQQVQAMIASSPETAESAEAPESAETPDQPSTQSQAEPAEQEAGQTSTTTPTPRARRRRGRVMAPAGPPRPAGDDGGDDGSDGQQA